MAEEQCGGCRKIFKQQLGLDIKRHGCDKIRSTLILPTPVKNEDKGESIYIVYISYVLMTEFAHSFWVLVHFCC